MTDKKECHCLIRHAINPEDRAVALDRLRRSRQVGDESGTLIALASLGPCPRSAQAGV